MSEQLLRVEFKRDALSATDDPLQFVLGEVQAIVERGVPIDVRMLAASANKIVVTVTVD